MSDTNHTVFVDSIGRAILGESVDTDNKDVLTVKNPAIVHVQPNQQTGQIHVQLIPYFFKEFNETDKDTVWEFPLSTIVRSSGLRVHKQLVDQYKNIVDGTPSPAPAAPPTEQVVKLFDDEEK